MSYAGKFLKSKGQDCTINRLVPVQTKASIKRSTRSSRDLGVREAYWEGLILADSILQSGELVEIRNKKKQSIGKFLVQSANYDPASEETAFFAAKCNAIVQHKRYEESVDGSGNIVQDWVTKNADIPCYGQIITAQLRQEDPGLLDGTKYIFQVPKSLGVMPLDRFLYDGDNYQVTSVDSIGMAGVSRIQLSDDTRP